MKTIFVVNPKAGKGKSTNALTEKIIKLKENAKHNIEMHLTQSQGDAESCVKKYCNDYQSEELRFIACGGDGTLNEVLNGAINYDNASIGVIPIGTGNDFCRNFPKECDYHNLEAQIYGETVKCDAIKYTLTSPDDIKEKYCANMFNIGFDCNVADMTASMKKIPLVSGSLAYLISIFVILIKKKGAELKILLDDNEIYKGKLLLTSIANGSFCGGGVFSNPMANINDGMIDVNIVKNISRSRLISLLPSYMKGTHMNIKNIEEILIYKKCKKMEIASLNNTIRLCTDGEISDAKNVIFESVPNAFNFILPIPKDVY